MQDNKYRIVGPDDLPGMSDLDLYRVVEEQGRLASRLDAGYRAGVLTAARAELAARVAAVRAGEPVSAGAMLPVNPDGWIDPDVLNRLPDLAVVVDASCADLSPAEAGAATGGFVCYQKVSGRWVEVSLDSVVTAGDIITGDPMFVGTTERPIEPPGG